MSRKFQVMVMLVALCFVAVPVIAATLTSQEVYEINQATPGTSKVALGDKLRGQLVVGATTQAASLGYATGNTTVFATPTTTVFLKTTPAAWGDSYRLGNGYEGQTLTVVLVTDGGQDYTVTPNTKTGFTSVTLNDAKDAITLKFIDSTVGWVVQGNNGATVN